ncbi:MAG: aminoacetone oxidase family FAD-binding enzyme [Lachnospiraceae bacterium]|nr:aminoacetone oxidase family FAD-binding enzyme [Lachnospiraceae bacterium]
MSLRIVVIGGGASGLMAAICAARLGAAVTVLEKNEKPGRKLLATGNGRCNLTNLRQEPDCYRTSDSELAQTVLKQFTLGDTLSFFEQLGICIHERNGWIYPASEQAESVLNVLLLEAGYRKVKIKTRETVQEILPDGQGYLVKTGTWQYPADRVIVCCGSAASAVPGSGNFAQTIAKDLKLLTVPFLPSLCPLKCSGERFSSWAGVRILGSVKLLIDGKEAASEKGELQLTEYGISGIPVFQISGLAVRSVNEKRKVEVVLDFMPERSEEELVAFLEQRRKVCPYKKESELLIGVVPEKLIPIFLSKGKEFSRIASVMKQYRLKVLGQSDFARGQVCQGGIRLCQLTKDLESQKYPGLFFAGEALDVDGACGGYNLQWAWSSGAVTGMASAKEREQ